MMEARNNSTWNKELQHLGYYHVEQRPAALPFSSGSLRNPGRSCQAP